MDASEAELQILESIHRSECALRQRDLARIAGLSLGMTNAIVRRLARKGWLSIRKINNRNIRYLMTADGVQKIAQRSYGYLKRTVGSIVRYREAMGLLLDEAVRRGARGVMLVGRSDLEFILEHLCEKRPLAFRRADGDGAVACPADWLVVYSEQLAPPAAAGEGGTGMSAYLREVLGRASATVGAGSEA